MVHKKVWAIPELGQKKGVENGNETLAEKDQPLNKCM